MNREELAWAAGFFDGEGCAYLALLNYESIYAGHRTYAKPTLTAAQVDRRVLDRFQRALGMGRVTGPTPGRGPNERPKWRYELVSWREVQAAIAILWAFLSPVKREQCADMLRRAKPLLQQGHARASQTRCKHGHSLEDAYVWDGRRYCRSCQIDRGRRRRERILAAAT